MQITMPKLWGGWEQLEEIPSLNVIGWNTEKLSELSGSGTSSLVFPKWKGNWVKKEDNTFLQQFLIIV